VPDDVPVTDRSED